MSNPLTRRDVRNQISGLYEDPFLSLERQMNQWFRNAFSGGGQDGALGNYPVDVEEDDDQITIDAELPGFKHDEIDVNLENGVLTIKAERRPEQDQDQAPQKRKHLSERRYARVQRSFTLPRSVDGSEVNASLNDGVLTLKLKKSEESKPRRIEIQS